MIMVTNTWFSEKQFGFSFANEFVNLTCSNAARFGKVLSKNYRIKLKLT